MERKQEQDDDTTLLAGEYGVVTKHENTARKVFKLHENKPGSPDLMLSMKRENAALKLLTKHAVSNVPHLITSGINFHQDTNGHIVHEGVIVMTWCGDPFVGPIEAEDELRNIAQSLTGVLARIHQLGLIHRDIKIENLVRESETGKTFLIDFGISRHLAVEKSGRGLPAPMTSNISCIAHRAPEASYAVCCQREMVSYTSAIDIWSLGSTLLELVTGMDDMPIVGGWEDVRSVCMGDVRLQLEDHISASAADFIMSCLKVAPSLRPSAIQLLEHPWLS